MGVIMGLDIAFDKELALKAGLVTHKERNGCEQSIKQAMNDPLAEDDYKAWLQAEITVLHVPNTDITTEVYADTEDPRFIVRANKWGSIYKPLTTFLTEANIPWEEF